MACPSAQHAYLLVYLTELFCVIQMLFFQSPICICMPSMYSSMPDAVHDFVSSCLCSQWICTWIRESCLVKLPIVKHKTKLKWQKRKKWNTVFTIVQLDGPMFDPELYCLCGISHVHPVFEWIFFHWLNTSSWVKLLHASSVKTYHI